MQRWKGPLGLFLLLQVAQACEGSVPRVYAKLASKFALPFSNPFSSLPWRSSISLTSALLLIRFATSVALSGSIRRSKYYYRGVVGGGGGGRVRGGGRGVEGFIS